MSLVCVKQGYLRPHLYFAGVHGSAEEQVRAGRARQRQLEHLGEQRQTLVHRGGEPRALWQRQRCQVHICTPPPNPPTPY